MEEMPGVEQKSIPEFAYFDGGFKITVHTHRWSFFELRSFINSFRNTLDEDSMLRETMSRELRTCDESKVFDDKFFLELSRKVDACEDLYYEENASISLFMTGILKILNENLELNWSAVQLRDYSDNKLKNIVYSPAKIEQKKVHNFIKSSGDRLISKPIEFCNEHVANIIVNPSPFSPKKCRIHTFLDFVIMHIDDFVYGDMYHKQEIIRLQSEIAQLHQQKSIHRLEMPSRSKNVKRKIRLIVLGDAAIKKTHILGICKDEGYDKDKRHPKKLHSKIIRSFFHVK